MADVYIYQIYYDGASKAALDAGFTPLDNSNSARPDWFEYQPIRKFLSEHKLEDDAYYGFFSPRFGSKTNLNSDKVRSFVRANAGTDIALFCPFFDQSAFFVNVFEQGGIAHPGLLQVSQEFADAAGIDVDIKSLVTDSTTTIFSNYFVARPRFWMEWFRVAEELYKRAEELPPGKTPSLVTPTSHGSSQTIQFKVFIMERLATLLLATSDIYKVAAYEPTALTMSPAYAPFARQAAACDALKLAYGRLQNRKYLDEFFALRGAVLNAIRKQFGGL
jgi:hypothetical protein